MDPITILVEIFLKFLEKAKIIYRPKVNVNPLVSPKDPQGGTIVVKRRKDKDWFNIKIELSLFGSLNLSKYLGKHGLIVTIIFKVDNHQVTISDGNKNSVSSLIINENNSEANSTKNFQLICGELSDPDITSTDLRSTYKIEKEGDIVGRWRRIWPKITFFNESKHNPIRVIILK